jgi:Domain of unknown function (DUF5615)
MRFLMDANLPRSAAALLQQMGHDAVDVRDIGMGGAADDVIAAHARREQRALVTRDFDSGQLTSRKQNMRSQYLVRTTIALTVALVLSSFATPTRADPLITQGVGLASCAKLAADLKPSEELNHPPNYLLFYWVQGYISAANIFLLNEYTNYVDMNEVDASTILKLVSDFCKANPDKKPISAIDKFLREATKVDAKEKDAFNPWEQ